MIFRESLFITMKCVYKGAGNVGSIPRRIKWGVALLDPRVVGGVVLAVLE